MRATIQINVMKGRRLDETTITEEDTISLANEIWWDLMNDGKKSDRERLFQFSDY